MGQDLDRRLRRLPGGRPQLNRGGGLGRDRRDTDHVMIPIERQLLGIDIEALPARLDAKGSSLLPVAEDRRVEDLPQLTGLLAQKDRVFRRKSEGLRWSLLCGQADVGRPVELEPRHYGDYNGEQDVSHDEFSRRRAGAAQMVCATETMVRAIPLRSAMDTFAGRPTTEGIMCCRNFLDNRFACYPGRCYPVLVADGRQHDRFITDVYNTTKRLDPTRPVHDVSGGYHAKTDIWSWHNYEQSPGKFSRQLLPDTTGGGFRPPTLNPKWDAPYTGQPYFLDEYGGIKWIAEDRRPFADNSWGYGDRCKSVEEFYTRFEGLCAALLENPGMFGYCYTQLTDVFQEQNGIYRFDRTTKFDMPRIKAAQQKQAAIER